MEYWYYSELKQTGINFENIEEVKQYDEKYKNTRNLDSEAESIIKALELKPNSKILEIGTGTGEMAIRLSKQCKKVYACDVSKTMLDYALDKAKKGGSNNIEFAHAGFLNFEIKPKYFDAVITQLSLHHLPDFWKSVALDRISHSLKTGGRFFLLDSILSFNISIFEDTINNIIALTRKSVGDRIANEIIVNIKDEYPTYDWIIEGLIQKSGLKIIYKNKYNDIMSSLICKKGE